MVPSSDPFVVNYYRFLLEEIHADPDGEYYNYTELLNRLWETPFTCRNDRDVNRIADGKWLRYEYAYQTGLPYSIVEESSLSVKQCSILEMMVALAKKMEDSLLDNWIEKRIHVWFWRMIGSLGLESYTDWHWRVDEVDYILDNFLNLRYSADGQGSLFTIYEIGYDARAHEIWEQMQRWVYENIAYYNPDGAVKQF